MSEATAIETASELSLAPAHAITREDIATFERDGVVCLRGMFDADWCSALLKATEDVMASGAGRVREPKLGEGQGRFYSNVYLGDLDPRFRRLCNLSPAPVIAAELMQCDSVRFYYDQIFVKLPGTSAPTPWHNDLPFWPFQGEDLISIWIALTPVSKATSGVQYVAGSHRWGTMFQAVTPDYDPRFADPSMQPCPDYGADDADPSVKVLSWDMQPGDALCHHPLTVHGAGGNTSATQMRAGISVRYLGRDVRWDPRPHTMKLRRDPGVAQGDYPADDETLPIVWERDRGHVAAH
ncbi:MAG: phytanoyl-CoA dioxygenase family protein [Variovorax sp.]